MSRANAPAVMAAGFDATVHIALDTLVDVLGHAIVQETFAATFEQETTHADGFVERNRFALRAPTATATAVAGAPQPIPSGINATDPPLPADAVPQGVLLEVRGPFTLDTNNRTLDTLGVTQLEGVLVLTVRPFVSPSVGLGLERFDVAVELTASSPTALGQVILDGVVAPQVRDAVYPEVLGLLELARFQLPDVAGLSVSGARVFGPFDDGRPVTLSLALGAAGDPAALQPLLDPGDGLIGTVGAALFDRKIAEFNQDLPRKSFNWDENRWETLNFARMSLRDGAVRLDLEIEIDPHGVLVPAATLGITGPLALSITGAGVDARLAADGSRLDVSLPGWLHFLRGLSDVLTLGLAELAWHDVGDSGEDFFDTTRRDARSGISAEVGSTLHGALLAPFVSGVEIVGRDRFMTRESAVIWGMPNLVAVSPAGVVLGGPARGGIRHAPRHLDVAAVHLTGGTIESYAFDTFHLRKDRALILWGANQLRINGVERRSRKGVPYLRDRPDRRTDDNLTSRPRFDPAATDLPDASAFAPLVTRAKYGLDAAGTLVRLDTP